MAENLQRTINPVRGRLLAHKLLLAPQPTPCLTTKALPLSTASTIKKNFSMEFHTTWEENPGNNICPSEAI